MLTVRKTDPRPSPFVMLTIFAGLVTGSRANAAETAFGIPLGAPFTISECKKDKFGYSGVTDQLCFERLTNKKDSAAIVNGTVRLRFPLKESPEIVKGGVIIAQIIDGNIEGTGFNTWGIRNQDEVLNALKAKYGEPSVLEPSTVQTAAGASFQMIKAVWNTDAIDVTFQGTTSSIDSGLVNIDTKTGNEWRSSALKTLTENKRAL